MIDIDLPPDLSSSSLQSDLFSSLSSGSLDLDTIETAGFNFKDDEGQPEDIFNRRRKAWNEEKIEPRCDFAPHRQALVGKSPLWCICLFRRSDKGPTLKEIKADPDRAEFIAERCARFIRAILADNLDQGSWAIITPPPRRHTENNFACRAARLIGQRLRIPFEAGTTRAKNRGRINPEFQLIRVPDQPNLILFDDILTTGSTMTAVWNIFANQGKTLFSFAAINNMK